MSQDENEKQKTEQDMTEDVPSEQQYGRRDFLAGMGKWSKAIIAGAVFGTILGSHRKAEAGRWINRRGGGGYRGGGGRWVNRGVGGGGWINRGGGGWVNRGGSAWSNRGGGSGWVNRRGGYGYGGGGRWVNRRGGYGGGGRWVNRF